MPIVDGKIRNPSRARYYGLDVDDIISYSPFRTEKRIGKVVTLGYGDNNRVHILFDGDKETSSCVAEWCTRINDKGWPLNKINSWFMSEFYNGQNKINAKKFNFMLTEFKAFGLTAEQVIEVIVADHPTAEIVFADEAWTLTYKEEEND